MNSAGRQRLLLAARNEGRIKSYESCVDVRAWSHDIRVRDRYLRDWIKRDMPICVLPVCTLASILTIMACKSRGRVPSRCPPNCSSKMLIDSLCSSCSVMKDCLRNNKEFEKYFREEDFETLYWPCDRCLNILKSVKLFWKIVIEKVLKINLPKPNEVKRVKTLSSIQNIAKEWRKEVIQNATFVKSTTLLYKQEEFAKTKSSSIDDEMNGDSSRINNDYKNSPQKSLDKATETECGVRSIAIQKDGKNVRKKINKYTYASIKTVDMASDACNEKENENDLTESKIEKLEQQFSLQKQEVDRLKNENTELKIELEHICHERLNNVSFYNSNSSNTNNNTIALVPRSLENEQEENVDLKAKNIDSELVITFKNYKNETFRHVSMLQVLHKTNGRMLNLKETTSCCNNEDPIDLLNTVHKAFGKIVSREISIANNTKFSKNNEVDITATFRKVGVSKSAPSCTTSSYSLFSASFDTAKDKNEVSSA